MTDYPMAHDLGRIDIAVLLDDYFFALSLAAPDAAPDAVRDLWARASRDRVEQHPRYLMAPELSRKAWRSSALTERRIERTFADWVDGQDALAPRDVLGSVLLRLGSTRHFVRSERIVRCINVSAARVDQVAPAASTGGRESCAFRR